MKYRTDCSFCGDPIITKRSRPQDKSRRFCTRRCGSLSQRINDLSGNYILMGFAFTIYGCGRLICENCLSEDTDVLDVHHKDGNHNNNDLQNLATLCANCHLKIHRTGTLNRFNMVESAYKVAQHMLI